MKLVNGRGQLGEELKKYEDMLGALTMYHTWNFLDKTETTQWECFWELRAYVKNIANIKQPFVFISTYTNTYTPYLKYKMLAECHLLDYFDKCIVFRLPNLLGRGLCENFKTGKLKPDDGSVELITIQDAVKKMIDKLLVSSFEKNEIIRIEGTVIPVKLLNDIIQFGKA